MGFWEGRGALFQNLPHPYPISRGMKLPFNPAYYVVLAVKTPLDFDICH